MCIIVVKPQSVTFPKWQHLQDCFEDNPHGAGYMLLRENVEGIKINKGFKTYKEFVDAVKKERIKPSDLFVAHFRIATSGLIDGGNCHPFPISSRVAITRLKEVHTNRICVAHNGIIDSLDGVHKKYSDTVLFVTELLSDKVVYNNLYDNKTVQELVANYAEDSRLAFLHREKGLLLIGDFTENEGCLYSKDIFTPVAKSWEPEWEMEDRKQGKFYSKDFTIEDCLDDNEIWDHCINCDTYGRVHYIHAINEYLCEKCKKNAGY